jgi:replicative DNA helicase
MHSKTAYPVLGAQGSINKIIERRTKLNSIILSQNFNPFDEDAERAILGSLIAYPELQKPITARLTTDDFYLQKHKIIYQTITDLIYQERIPNLHILKDALEKQKQLDFVGGLAYLYQLSDEGVPPDIAYQIADNILKDKTKRRKASEKFKEMLYKANSEADIDETIGEALRDFRELSKDNKASIETFKSVLKNQLIEINEILKNPNVIRGLPSGFYELDRLTSGFHGGELTVVGARPGMGKTAFALNIAFNIASQGKKVLFFSLEMGKKQLSLRTYSMISEIPLSKIRSGLLNDEEVEKITNSYLENADILERMVLVDDVSYLSDIMKIAYSMDSIDLIIVDYLQLIKTKNKYQMRYQELADIVNSLKFLAKDLNVPIIALAQVNREVEKKADKRPSLADLRESGDIETTADVVMFIHREDYYKKENNTNDSITEIIVAKNRNGESGIVRLSFDKRIQKFSELGFNESDKEIDF